MPAQLRAFGQRYLDRILVTAALALLFWIWRRAHVEWSTDLYVPMWVDDRFLLFAAPAFLLAIFGLVRAALAGVLAFPLVVIIGEVLGGAAWDLQGMFLGPDHEQIHGGWAAATFLYAWVLIGAAWGEWRARRWEQIEAAEGQPDAVVTQP